MHDHEAQSPSATEMPIYHYTVGTSLASILASGQISTEEDYYFAWMAPAVRCTTRPDWEPTSGQSHFKSRRRLPWYNQTETAARCAGLIRMRVKPESVAVPWSDFLILDHVDDETAASTATDAMAVGSDTADWFVSLGPIQRCHWLSVEVWHEGAWVNVSVNE